MAPRFSIVTISFNHAEFIEQTIQSVRDQKGPDVQHIVIDGGSTDGTVQILKRYPHLEWISEPDRGISHALNKGFARCTGEIVSWLNADDWYAPGCLQAVSEAAKRYPIVMGDAVESDRKGNPVKTIRNIPRSSYDIARYWVPMAWLAQPSVFFSRELLFKARLPNGEFFDESFRYSMDADLWLRLGEHASFDGYVPQVLSHFRVYGDNKTGRTFAAPRKELGRAFRRAYFRSGEVERPISLVLPINRITTELTNSMASLLEQTFKDFELFIVDYSGDPITAKSIREMVLEMEEHTLFGIKYIQAPKPTELAAWNAGLAASRAPITGFFPSGTKLNGDALLQAQNIFIHDLYGAALALFSTPEEQGRIVDLQTGNLNTAALLAARDIFGVLFARTTAMREVSGFKEDRPIEAAVKGMLLSLLVKGWGLSCVNQIGIEPASRMREFGSEYSDQLRTALAPYEQAALVLECVRESLKDVFYPVRAASGVVRGFSEPDAQKALSLVEQAPPQFLDLSWRSDPVAVTTRFPAFAPGWLALAELCTARGQSAEAARANERYRALAGL